MAVVGHVDEEWVTPLDTRIAALGGAVVRRTRDEFVDAQFERDIAADKAELAALKAEHAKAIGEAKARLQAKIDATQKRLQHRRDQLKDWLAASKREDEARIKSIEEQAAKAKGEMKAKLEARGAKARADHKARAEKLSKAWELVKEAAAI
jgi:trehalose/maltose hydrolase-like predicted phosphorylase